MPTQVYPEDYSCILEPVDGKGGLFIGNLEAAQNMNTLKSKPHSETEHQIKAVLTAAKGVELGHSRTDVPYFLYVPADDHESFDLSKYFHQAADYINDCLQRTSIMVHCLAGVSRSVSLVLAFFIKHLKYSYQQAYDLVKSRRRIIHPNDGFIQHLKNLERELSSH
jgi:protein-tyrosine phosphatase